MKILVLANFDVGLYQFRRDLLESLLKNHEVLISLPDGDLVRPLEKMGCRFLDTPVDRRGINPVTDLKLLLRYGKILRAEKPELVITYTIKPNVYGGMLCRLLGVPYALNITGLGTTFQKRGLLKALVVQLYKLAARGAKVVFFENAGNLETMLDLGIVRQGQCVLLNGAGVNLDKYTFGEYPGGDEKTRFLFIGRVMAEKGINELFTVMERLAAEGHPCELDVLGHYEEDYKEEIDRCVRQGWLRYHGFQTDVTPFIAGAHCFVLPSWHEGMANTNLECAAMGRPLITSDIHGCREAVIENVSGLLCRPKDPDSLYGAMKAFLALAPEARAAMGRAGRRHMEEVFDKKKVVAQTIEGLGL